MRGSASLRIRFNKQSGTCAYCHHPMTLEKDKMSSATRDHIVPRAVGGPTTSFNIVIACYRCNQIKGSMSLSEFLSTYSPHRFPAPRGEVSRTNAWKISNIG